MESALWTSNSWIVVLLLGLCLVFAIAEGLIPGFGACGIISIICGTAAIICEAIFSQSLLYTLLMIVIMLVVFVILFSIFVYSVRKGMLKNTPIFDENTALPQEYNISDKKALVGKVGEVITECKPIGKAMFDGKAHTIISRDNTIKPRKLVIVEEVRDDLIFVRKLKGGKDE